MKLKKRTIILMIISIGIIILAILVSVSTLVYLYWTEWRVEKVRVTGGARRNYIEEYEDYYYKAKDGSGFFNSYTDIYFKPGQKEKMLEKIKEDVINELEKRIAEFSNVYYKYEISDDFKQVRIYAALSYSERYERRDELNTGVNIGSLIALYHNIKDGRIEGLSKIVTYIEPED